MDQDKFNTLILQAVAALADVMNQDSSVLLLQRQKWQLIYKTLDDLVDMYNEDLKSKQTESV